MEQETQNDIPKLTVLWDAQHWANKEFNYAKEENPTVFHETFAQHAELCPKTFFNDPYDIRDGRTVYLSQLLIRHLQNGNNSNNLTEINWVKREFDTVKKNSRHQFSPKKDAITLLKDYRSTLIALIFVLVVFEIFDLDQRNNQNLINARQLRQNAEALSAPTDDIDLIVKQISQQISQNNSLFYYGVFGLTIALFNMALHEYRRSTPTQLSSEVSRYTLWKAIRQPIHPEVKLLFDYLDKQIEKSLLALEKPEPKMK